MGDADGGLHEAQHSSPARRLALAGLAALLAGASGCASVAASRAGEARLQRELATARCERSLDDAWAEARRVLADHGYPLAAADSRAAGREPGLFEKAGEKGGALGKVLSPARDTREEEGERVLETGWLEGQRYRLAGAPAAPGCHVAFLAIRADPYEHNRDAWEAPRRDPQLELELLRRLAPDEAARVEAAARVAPGGT